ncbi:MAG: hypothetical protein K2L28_09360 [Muribaculaceae bacterium]|nr:hypothetical protein [Muribaculaceae bacterium]
MYSRANLAFEDPAAPRFLFLDKKGIGGYLKAVVEYDINGAVPDNDFCINIIPVPFDPAQRQRFGRPRNPRKSAKHIRRRPGHGSDSRRPGTLGTSYRKKHDGAVCYLRLQRLLGRHFRRAAVGRLHHWGDLRIGAEYIHGTR